MRAGWHKLLRHARLFGPGAAARELLKSARRFSDAAIEFIPLAPPGTPAPGADIAADSTVSVIIPVKNGGDDLAALLARLRRQKGFKAIEIIVVDSGSCDGSPALAERCGARLIRMPPETFSHAASRNLGAAQAQGEYLLFTVQDALPPGDDWLCRLFSIMQTNRLAAVSCLETPREGADLFYRAMTDSFYAFLEVDRQERIMRLPHRENHLTLRKNAQLSNIACLIGKDLFVRYRFRCDYGEDLDLGLRLIRDGHDLALLNSLRIIHSHHRPAYYYLKRGYVDLFFISQIIPGFPLPEAAPERLFQEIIADYHYLNQLVHHSLPDLQTPCAPRMLARMIQKPSRQPEEASALPPDGADGHHYHDPAYGFFIKKLARKYQRAGGGEIVAPGSALRTHLGTIVKYLGERCETIDEDMLEAVKNACYKAHALSTGASLAAAYRSGDEKARRLLKGIHEELMGGV